MAKKRVTASGMVRINAYEVIRRAIEEGVGYGYRRAFKYEDNPSEEHIRETIEEAVANALCEVVSFDDPYRADD